MTTYVSFVRGSSFRWKVENVLTIESLESDEFVLYECRWKLILDPVNTDCINIYLDKLNSERLNGTYLIHAFIENANNETASTHFYTLDDPDFESEEIWSINRSDLGEYLTHGTLTFVVVFTPTDILKADAKREKVSDKSVNVYTVPDLEKLSSDLRNLMGSGAQPDVTLKCDERSFPAHKNILSARSEVFSAMFRSDMAESRTGVIQISDVDASVLDQFLHYVYTGKLPNISVDTAIELYVAADKYSVESLKKLCDKFMKENITRENAYKILVHADTHGNKPLKDAVLCFIRKVRLLQNKDMWFEFHSEHPKLASEILYQAYEAKRIPKLK